MEYNFPAWRQVMPKADRPCLATVALNPRLLLALAEAMAAGECVVLEIESSTGPVIVRPGYFEDKSRRANAPIIPSAHGVIMPVTQPKPAVEQI